MIRLLIAAGVSIVISIIGTKILAVVLKRLNIGQPIREDGPRGHSKKAGTPTMGGLAIILAAVIGYVASALYDGIFTRTGLLVMMAICLSGAVGFADDLLKVRNERNRGLTVATKFLGLIIVAVLFVVLSLQFTKVNTHLSFTRFDSFNFDLGNVGWAVWGIFLILAVSNAVNLTDGLDGLAAGSSVFGYAAFVVIAFWAFRNESFYQIDHALDLAVIAASMLGACAGFLWWNAAPAQIFMGDTGSLSLGTGLACLALVTNTHLLLPVIGGIFTAEALSVVIQVAGFKLTGKRVFKMAPFHHHFELKGWHETWVIVRFWIIAGLCIAIALAVFYADWARLEG